MSNITYPKISTVCISNDPDENGILGFITIKTPNESHVIQYSVKNGVIMASCLYKVKILDIISENDYVKYTKSAMDIGHKIMELNKDWILESKIDFDSMLKLKNQ